MAATHFSVVAVKSPFSHSPSSISRSREVSALSALSPPNVQERARQQPEVQGSTATGKLLLLCQEIDHGRDRCQDRRLEQRA